MHIYEVGISASKKFSEKKISFEKPVNYRQYSGKTTKELSEK